MFLFIAPPNFSDFVRDEFVSEYLDVIRSMGTPEHTFNKTMSIVLFNLLKGVYELGDITRNPFTTFNILFCAEKTEKGLVIDIDSLEMCVNKLKDFCGNGIPFSQLTLIVPPFAEREEINGFVEDFAELYKDGEVEMNLAIMTVDFARSQLGLITDN